jgi:hypothetical protein
VELKKGGGPDALARAVCFHRLGRLRDRAVEAQQYRASGLAVVTAAIALWNTVYLGRARDDLHLGGEVIAYACLPTLPRLAGSTSTSPAIISGIRLQPRSRRLSAALRDSNKPSPVLTA